MAKKEKRETMKQNKTTIFTQFKNKNHQPGQEETTKQIKCLPSITVYQHKQSCTLHTCCCWRKLIWPLHILYTNIITCKQVCVWEGDAISSGKLTVIGLHIHIQKNTFLNILTINMIRPKIPSSMSVMFDSSVKNCRH